MKQANCLTFIKSKHSNTETHFCPLFQWYGMCSSSLCPSHFYLETKLDTEICFLNQFQGPNSATPGILTFMSKIHWEMFNWVIYLRKAELISLWYHLIIISNKYMSRFLWHSFNANQKIIYTQTVSSLKLGQQIG